MGHPWRVQLWAWLMLRETLAGEGEELTMPAAGPGVVIPGELGAVLGSGVDAGLEFHDRGLSIPYSFGGVLKQAVRT